MVFEKAIGREPTEEEAEALMRRRLDHLPEEVESSPGFVVKDGVVELLERLIEDGILLGLTTGNVEEAAHIKLARPNLNRYFAFGGYGSDSPDRTELTRKALESGRVRLGATPSTGTELLFLRRHASRRGGRPRRRHPGRGGRDRRVHGRGVDRGRRRRGGPFPRRRPSAPLVGRLGSCPPAWLIRHIAGQPPFDRAPCTVSRSYSIGWTSRHSLPKGSRKPASTP